MKVYWASVEYKYENNAENLVGGFVYAFINSYDEKSALNKIETKLNSENLIAINFEFIECYDELTEWENKKTTKHFLKLYEKAKLTSEVIFDDFYAYKNDE